MEVKLLKDKSRLPEIYQLRVTSYEESPYSKYINQQTYPDGYFDNLDALDTTLHWIIEENEKIVGSARAVVIDNTSLLQEDLTQLDFPNKTPFAYCGRTVVHPQYRKTDAMRQLDKAALQFLKENSNIKFGFCYVTPERVDVIKRFGFRSIGTCDYDWGNGNKTCLEAFVWEKPIGKSE